ncbi:SpoIID/LytB domain-containing protein [Patescibacteria group bacterium]|nr:SpoIID/LytB domain-containing protein [Patescibacteria group bacterium]
MLKKVVRLLFPIFLLFTIFASAAMADELLEVQKKIDTKNKEYSQTQIDIEAIKADIASLSVGVYSTQEELDEADKKVADIRKDLADVEDDLNNKRDELALVINIRDQQVRYLYKHPGSSPLELFVGSDGFANFTQLFGLQKRVLGTSKDLIEIINEEVAVVQKTHDEVAKATADLEETAAQISSQLASLQGSLSYQTNQQSVLTGQLVEIENNLKGLTSNQKQLIVAKLSKANKRQTVGDSAPASEPLPNPGFSPAYVWLTYGYPHRVGMNQYGAFGRAKVGKQGYKTILKAYYKGVSVAKYPVPSKIKVAGYGSISFEGNYLRGISEMPRSWPMEALKAQAVAARTYAVNWIRANPGGSICTSQSCQVYRGQSNLINCSGTYNKRWCDAVAATKGVVITYGGSPINAWYASTAGGYTLSSAEVWGGGKPYAQGIKDFGPKGAYDGPKYGNSPWYHTFWNGKGCTGAFPWLTKSEVTDIFNAALLSQKSSRYNKYLSQSPACPGRTAGWSAAKVRSTLSSVGVKDVGNLSNIFIGFDNKGHTSSVTFASNKYPAKTFSGSFFRSIFNLRSPGNLVIITSLYDVLIK